MSNTRPTEDTGSTSVWRPHSRAAAVLATVVLGLTITACGGPAEGTPSSAGASSSSAAGALTVDITIGGGDVTPNGQKLDVAVGQEVVLNVTSDETDAIHAHTGGDGFELEVEAGQPVTGRFTLTSPGSFEVESHHLEKVIVILNAR